MKKHDLIYLVLAAAIGMTASCQKGDNVFPDHFITPVAAAEIWEKYAPELQLFQGDAAAGFTIKGKNGVEITFPSGAFLDENNQPVNGMVTVRLKEYLSKAAIIFGGMPTESYGRLLETGGEIYVDAFLGEGPLHLNPDNNPFTEDVVRVEIPRDQNGNPEGMILFDAGDRERKPGDDNQGGWIPPVPVVDSNITWRAAAYYPFGNSPNTYWFNLPDFGWYNCDRLYNEPGTKVSIYAAPDAASPTGLTDLQVILVFKDIETVLTLIPGMNRFESYLNSLPEGAAATIILLGKDADGNLMLDHQDITITAEETYILLPEQVSQQEVADFIASIN